MIYVVGEKQGQGGTRRHLAEMFGTRIDEMTDAVIWLNLWEYDMQTDAAVSNLVHLIERSLQHGDACLLLGRRVVEAFALDRLEPLESVDRGDGAGPVIYAIPHPSGLNRWYNDPENSERAERLLRAVWGTHR